jgi:lysophospholipase
MMSDDTPLLIETEGNPVPGNHVAGWFEGSGGKRLRYAIFKSDVTCRARHGRSAAGTQ